MQPRYQRRKDARPAEITEAAMAAFAENGYAATRVDDVAKRAGVSKGLLYLYFKTKEDLFKAVIRSFIAPRIDQLSNTFEKSGLGAEAFIRGPFLAFVKTLPDSPIRILVRLMVSEGHKHPDLVEYYWEHVVSRGVGILKKIIQHGVDNGEFRRTPLLDTPQLLASPILFCVIWKTVFHAQDQLDSDTLIETHVDAMLDYLNAHSPQEKSR